MVNITPKERRETSKWLANVLYYQLEHSDIFWNVFDLIAGISKQYNFIILSVNQPAAHIGGVETKTPHVYMYIILIIIHNSPSKCKYRGYFEIIHFSLKPSSLFVVFTTEQIKRLLNTSVFVF